MKRSSKTLEMLAAGVGLVLMALLTASPAAAQQSVLLNGADTGTFPDGGIIRRVQVDSQGRLVIASSGTDGGTAVSVPYCSVTRSRTTSVGTSPTAVPADGGLAGRWFIRICNSARNTGVPIITCTSDGTSPDAGLLGDGETIEVDGCNTYTTGTSITCVSDTASTAVTSEECR